MNKFADIPVFSKFADNVIELSRARGRFADELFEPPVVALVSKFADEPKQEPQDFSHEQNTIRALIQRYVEEMKSTFRPVGLSGSYTYKNMALSSLGPIVAPALTDQDIITFCRHLQATGHKPCTAEKYISCLVVVLRYAKAAWPGCKDINADIVKDVKPFLVRNQLIAKSERRERLPLPEETERLIEHFRRPNPWNRRRIPMDRITRWQGVSARRISETCGLLWADWNRDEHTILVRKMKDPRTRNKCKRVALPDLAQAMLVEMWETRDPAEPRIFPYRAESCIAAYVAAKKVLDIEGLHLHDSRAHCATYLMEELGYSPTEAILVTGHENTKMLEDRYARLNPEKFRLGPVRLRLAA